MTRHNPCLANDQYVLSSGIMAGIIPDSNIWELIMAKDSVPHFPRVCTQETIAGGGGFQHVSWWEKVLVKSCL